MPRKSYAPHKKSEERRRDIVQAALVCFGEFGFANTTMEDIRLRSGASNGSIYHHYSSKEGLAATIYVEAIVDYQRAILTALEHNPKARAGVHAVVHAHLEWVEQNPQWARYLMEMRHAEFMAAAENALAEANKNFISSFINWLRPNLRSGAIRRLAADVFVSILLGPCQEYVRNWLGESVYTDIPTARKELAEAAWIALRGKEQT